MGTGGLLKELLEGEKIDEVLAGGARGLIAVGLAESWRWPRELASGQAVGSIGYRTRLDWQAMLLR